MSNVLDRMQVDEAKAAVQPVQGNPSKLRLLANRSTYSPREVFSTPAHTLEDVMSRAGQWTVGCRPVPSHW